ncbi:MAG: hypothetical protein J2P45_24100, partial [Candidatus Dormibacteraeota bacterium]|nr:hypothetical protein [Candidatus Dormibacteraeota bacterium]
ALHTLENLQRSSEKVVAAIIQAGSDGAGAGTGAGSGVPGLGQDLWAAAKGFVIPPANMGAAGYALFATRRGLTAFGGLKNWMTKVELGRWAPRDALGRFVSPKDLSWWETALKSRASTNWIAKPNLADTRGLWSTAGKWGGRAGGVLGIGTAALGQWMQDSGNPHLDTTARVARTAEAGIVTGGLGWGGAIAGAEAGGVIGSIFPGPGTVIGAFIGGIAGGVAGSGFGSYVVGHTAGAIGDAADWTGHEVTSLGGGAVHALESLNPF